MRWNPEQLLADFLVVAELGEIKMEPDAIRVETLMMPHRPPRNLPKGKIAVYVFSDKERVLKVGKAGPQSQPRYTNQHYNAGSAPSTLAASILKDEDAVQRYGLNKRNISGWIKKNTDRVNFIVDADYYGSILNLLEAFVQCRLQPVYEGKQRNKGRKG
ncbi:hypothetical protein F4X33_19325 [Candidatus Poribacteria bacterium]|nr:hypothetical protein [Candidatus Poribacteria bacterium]